MILADKIITLRKKSGISQEELAEKLNVSRQSVSKWESAQSIPDLDKILAMSAIFGVSTDFLLKDELEMEDICPISDDSSGVEKRKVTMEMATDFIEKKNKTAPLIALGTSLCILSPVTLILLAGICEYYNTISENLGCSIGLAVMFILIAIGVALFLLSNGITKEYEFISNKAFETEYGVTGMVKQKKKDFSEKYTKWNIIGILLCIVSVIPLFISAFLEDEMFAIYGVISLFSIVAIAVFILVFVGNKQGALQRLLQEGDYTKETKAKSPLIEAISSAYWLIATAIYLVWSFVTKNWEFTWIVWPIAGILYAAIFPIIKTVSKKK